MADPDDPAEATSRLEVALERIAALANRPAIVASADMAEPPAVSGAIGPVVDTTELATRLDALIAQLRSALAA